MAIEITRATLMIEPLNLPKAEAIERNGVLVWEQGEWIGFYKQRVNREHSVHEIEIGIRFQYENKNTRVNAFDLFFLVNRLSAGQVDLEFYNRELAKGHSGLAVVQDDDVDDDADDEAAQSFRKEGFLNKTFVEISVAYMMCDNIERIVSKKNGQKIRAFIDEQVARHAADEFVM